MKIEQYWLAKKYLCFATPIYDVDESGNIIVGGLTEPTTPEQPKEEQPQQSEQPPLVAVPVDLTTPRGNIPPPPISLDPIAQMEYERDYAREHGLPPPAFSDEDIKLYQMERGYLDTSNTVLMPFVPGYETAPEEQKIGGFATKDDWINAGAPKGKELIETASKRRELAVSPLESSSDIRYFKTVQDWKDAGSPGSIEGSRVVIGTAPEGVGYTQPELTKQIVLASGETKDIPIMWVGVQSDGKRLQIQRSSDIEKLKDSKEPVDPSDPSGMTKGQLYDILVNEGIEAFNNAINAQRFVSQQLPQIARRQAEESIRAILPESNPSSLNSNQILTALQNKVTADTLIIAGNKKDFILDSVSKYLTAISLQNQMIEQRNKEIIEANKKLEAYLVMPPEYRAIYNSSEFKDVQNQIAQNSDKPWLARTFGTQYQEVIEYLKTAKVDIGRFIKEHPIQDTIKVLQTINADKKVIDDAQQYINGMADAMSKLGNIHNLSGTEIYALGNAIELAGLDLVSAKGGVVGQLARRVDETWQSLNSEQKQKVAELYVSDLYKDNPFAEFVYSSQIAMEKEPSNILVNFMVMPTLTPIAKSLTGQQVSAMEWVGGAFVPATLALGGIGGALGGVTQGVTNVLNGLAMGSFGAYGLYETTDKVLMPMAQGMTPFNAGQLALSYGIDGLMLAGAIGSFSNIKGIKPQEAQLLANQSKVVAIDTMKIDIAPKVPVTTQIGKAISDVKTNINDMPSKTEALIDRAVKLNYDATESAMELKPIVETVKKIGVTAKDIADTARSLEYRGRSSAIDNLNTALDKVNNTAYSIMDFADKLRGIELKGLESVEWGELKNSLARNLQNLADITAQADFKDFEVKYGKVIADQNRLMINDLIGDARRTITNLSKQDQISQAQLVESSQAIRDIVNEIRYKTTVLYQDYARAFNYVADKGMAALETMVKELETLKTIKQTFKDIKNGIETIQNTPDFDTAIELKTKYGVSFVSDPYRQLWETQISLKPMLKSIANKLDEMSKAEYIATRREIDRLMSKVIQDKYFVNSIKNEFKINEQGIPKYIDDIEKYLNIVVDKLTVLENVGEQWINNKNAVQWLYDQMEDIKKAMQSQDFATAMQKTYEIDSKLIARNESSQLVGRLNSILTGISDAMKAQDTYTMVNKAKELSAFADTLKNKDLGMILKQKALAIEKNGSQYIKAAEVMTPEQIAQVYDGLTNTNLVIRRTLNDILNQTRKLKEGEFVATSREGVGISVDGKPYRVVNVESDKATIAILSEERLRIVNLLAKENVELEAVYKSGIIDNAKVARLIESIKYHEGKLAKLSGSDFTGVDWRKGRLNPYMGNDKIIDSITTKKRTLGWSDEPINNTHLQKIKDANLSVKDTEIGKIIYDPIRASQSDVDNVVNVFKRVMSKDLGDKSIHANIDVGRVLQYTDDDIAAYLRSVALDWESKGFGKPPWTLEDIRKYAPDWYKAVTRTDKNIDSIVMDSIDERLSELKYSLDEIATMTDSEKFTLVANNVEAVADIKTILGKEPPSDLPPKGDGGEPRPPESPKGGGVGIAEKTQKLTVTGGGFYTQVGEQTPQLPSVRASRVILVNGVPIFIPITPTTPYPGMPVSPEIPMLPLEPTIIPFSVVAEPPVKPARTPIEPDIIPEEEPMPEAVPVTEPKIEPGQEPETKPVPKEPDREPFVEPVKIPEPKEPIKVEPYPSISPTPRPEKPTIPEWVQFPKAVPTEIPEEISKPSKEYEEETFREALKRKQAEEEAQRQAEREAQAEAQAQKQKQEEEEAQKEAEREKEGQAPKEEPKPIPTPYPQPYPMEEPITTEEPSPERERIPEKPIVRPPVKVPPKKPPTTILPRLDDEDKKNIINNPPKGSVCFIQGRPQYVGDTFAPMYKLITPPYKQEDMISTRIKPKGYIDEGYTGEGAAKKSIQILGGLPEHDIKDLDLGFVKINILIRDGKPIIEYPQDADSNVGDRSVTVGMGVGQIPIEEWEKAKAQGVPFEDFVTSYNGKMVGEYEEENQSETPETQTFEATPTKAIGLDKEELTEYRTPQARIYLVNGNFVRNNLWQDYTQGGHWKVYPEFIPEKEIWIDRALDTDEDIKATILHELVEMEAMKDDRGRDNTYSDIHNDVANPAEEIARNNPEKTEEMIQAFLVKYRVDNRPLPPEENELSVSSYKVKPKPKRSSGNDNGKIIAKIIR
ncbi:hypothetical protein M0R04_08165 [Candidatus Dojkabacteria bacterium]|jgi:uncharacterized protein YoxC|nr:hypothetical protein [Candidatus Dojkabacteria bacterium]